MRGREQFFAPRQSLRLSWQVSFRLGDLGLRGQQICFLGVQARAVLVDIHLSLCECRCLCRYLGQTNAQLLSLRRQGVYLGLRCSRTHCLRKGRIQLTQ